MKTFLISVDWGTTALFLNKNNNWFKSSMKDIWAEYVEKKDLAKHFNDTPAPNKYHDEMAFYTKRLTDMYTNRQILFFDNIDKINVNEINDIWSFSNNNIDNFFNALKEKKYDQHIK